MQNENLTAALAEPADLLILDEAGSAWELDMVDKDLLRRAVLERPAAQECVLTAHKAPQWMLDAADYSTEMKCRRHPYQKGIKARKASNTENARRTAAFSGPPGVLCLLFCDDIAAGRQQAKGQRSAQDVGHSLSHQHALILEQMYADHQCQQKHHALTTDGEQEGRYDLPVAWNSTVSRSTTPPKAAV